MKTQFFVLLFILLTACSAASALDERDSGGTFSARVGDRPVILLPENPTTGYSWQFFITPENQQIVTDVKETYIAPDTQLVGAGGHKEYTFSLRRKGKVTVTGYYFRPWEKLNKETDKTVTYSFDVTD